MWDSFGQTNASNNNYYQQQQQPPVMYQQQHHSNMFGYPPQAESYDQQHYQQDMYADMFVPQQVPAQSSAPMMEKASAQGKFVSQPCLVCGKEALFECNLCASLRRKGVAVASTYFCSPEHQSVVWKEHMKYHEKLNL